MNKPVDFKKISAHPTPDESPGFLLWKVSTLWRRSIEKTLKVFGLTHPQFVILAATGWLTRKGEKPTQAQIGKLAGLDPNTTSQIMRGLQAKKLITRLNSIDERSKSPTLTAKGTQILAQALPAVEHQDAAFFAPLDSQKSGILKALQKLAQKPNEVL
jgi:DNA-binding MarR family transcriptional regulator